MSARSPTGASDGGLHDHVDRLVEGWRQERPDLDVAPLAVVYRVIRLAGYLNAAIEPVFADAGITSGDFAVLANLRRRGAPFRLTQRELMDALALTAGTVSVRIDRLVERGLVSRLPDPDSGRRVLVTLTDQGTAVFDAVAPVHLANEARLVSALSPDRQRELGDLLRTLLLEFEPPEGGRPGSELGLHLAAAHLGRSRRAAVGLPPSPGLLVESVVPGSPAEVAGLRPGDLLVRLGREPVTSLDCVGRALARGRRRLAAEVRRGDDVLALELVPAADR